jgi:hypothetical protein
MDDLKKRVGQFNSMSLPGQPIGVHMGTMYLVNDLWREIERLREENTTDCYRPATALQFGSERR